jgi:cytoskeletal protein RodZ
MHHLSKFRAWMLAAPLEYSPLHHGGEELMRLSRVGVILVSVALLAAASGCSHEQSDWHSAQAANTIEAYEAFVSAHPKSARAADAQAQIEQLTEARDWQRASTIDTADAYRQFLAQHPQAKSAQEARIRIENFGMSSAATAGGGATPAAAPAASPAAAAPSAKPAKPGSAAAAPQSAAGERYSVQLGAFTTQAKAQSQWQRLNARFGAKLHGTESDIEPAKNAHGKRIYRLKAKPLTEARARALCAALRKRGQACVVAGPSQE